MTAMAAKLLVVVAVAVLVAGGLVMTPSRAEATVSTADAAVVDVCRFLPFTADPAIAGRVKTVFAVRVTNVGSTVSEGPVLAAVSQPGRQKSGLPPASSGPLAPGQTVRVKIAASQLVPGAPMTVIAVFDSTTNPTETWANNLTVADVSAVPAC